MNQFTYENQGVNTFLVYEMTKTEVIDSLSLGMITNNKIENILPVIYTQIDDKKYLKYNVSSKISVKQFFEGTVNKKRLLGVFSSIASGVLAAEEYMLETFSFMFDLNYIFADVTNCEASIICLPVIDSNPSAIDLKSFFKNIVFSTQFDQTENCDYVAKIISNLNSSDAFSLVDFKKTIDSLMINQSVNQEAVINHNTFSDNSAFGYQQVSVNNQAQKMDSQSQSGAVNIIQPVQSMAPHPQTIVNPSPMAVPQMEVPAIPTPINTEKTEMKKEKKSWFGIKKEKQPKQPKPAKKQKEAKSYVNEKTGRKIAIPGMDGNEIVPMQQSSSITAPNQSGADNLRESSNSQINRVGYISSPQVEGEMAAASMETYAQQPMSQQIPPQQNSPNMYASAVSSQSFGETTVLGNSMAGETTVLGTSTVMQSRPYLIRNKNSEKIYLDKPVFRIGKEKSFVDYFIGDNAAISRSHVNIIRRGENYYIVDTNSTNHTYVNGSMIQSNVETPLNHGTRFMLADEEFEYRSY